MNDKIDYKQMEDRIDSLVGELRSIQNAGKYPQKVCNPVMHSANILDSLGKVIFNMGGEVDRLKQENAELREAVQDLLDCKGILTSDKECVIKAKQLLRK